MTGQSRFASLVESIVNVAVGLAINICAQIALFPAFGVHVSLISNAMLATIFTAISIARFYCLRRVFNSVAGRGR